LGLLYPFYLRAVETAAPPRTSLKPLPHAQSLFRGREKSPPARAALREAGANEMACPRNPSARFVWRLCRLPDASFTARLNLEETGTQKAKWL